MTLTLAQGHALSHALKGISTGYVLSKFGYASAISVWDILHISAQNRLLLYQMCLGVELPFLKFHTILITMFSIAVAEKKEDIFFSVL